MARVVLRNAITIALLLAMMMLVGLFLPRVPAAPYLPFLVIGIALLVGLYLVWDSLKVFHHRLEEVLRQRLLGEGAVYEEDESAPGNEREG